MDAIIQPIMILRPRVIAHGPISFSGSNLWRRIQKLVSHAGQIYYLSPHLIMLLSMDAVSDKWLANIPLCSWVCSFCSEQSSKRNPTCDQTVTAKDQGLSGTVHIDLCWVTIVIIGLRYQQKIDEKVLPRGIYNGMRISNILLYNNTHDIITCQVHRGCC